MPEKLLNEKVIQQVRDAFADLQQPVDLLFFGRKADCDYCDDTLQLLSEVAEVSEKLSIQVYDLDDDAEVAEHYNVDKAPGLVLVARDGETVTDYGVRYAGIPAGHEFSSLIFDLIRVSQRDSGLDAATREFLHGLQEPVNLMVFVTPSCPYCPQAVLLAHQMAMESPMVQAEMVEATEFPELSNRYNVSGVPQTTINYGAGTMVGAAPAEMLAAEIRKALQKA